jgi:NAD-dependent dihydropyrimidine dehydrogenase PreA subunit
MVIVLAAHLVPPFFAAAFLMGHFAPLAEPRLWPARHLRVAIVAGLGVAALLFPVTSLARADFSKTPGAVPFDWILLFPMPAMAILPGYAFWGVAAVLLALIGLVPYLLTRRETRAFVQIREDDCVGCGLCVKDCPYKALDLFPRPAHSKYPWVATLEQDRCIDCGVCVGSCGFHALDITRRPVADIRADARSVEGKVVAYVCANVMKKSGAVEVPGVTVVSVACGGQVYPGWVEEDLRCGAAGVIVAVCAPFSCAGRLGSTHESARIGHERRPFLRKRVERGKIGYAWFSPDECGYLARTLAELAVEVGGGVAKHDGRARLHMAAVSVAITALIAVTIPLFDFTWERFSYALGDTSMSQVIVSFDTHEACEVKIFFGGKLAVEKSFPKADSIDPVKVAVTARIPGGSPEARVQIVEGSVATEKAVAVPSGRRVAFARNLVTGEFEFKW